MFKFQINNILSKKIKNWINRPVSFFTTAYEKLFIPLLISLSLYIMTISLTPKDSENILNIEFTDIDNATQNNFIDYSLIIFIVLAFYNFITPVFTSRFMKKFKWTIKKILIYFLINIATICLVDVIYFYIVTSEQILFSRFINLYIEDFYQAILLGIVPCFICIYWLEKKYLKTEITRIKKIVYVPDINPDKLNYNIVLPSANNKMEIAFTPNNFFLIKAEGNYCNIFYLKNGGLQKTMLRNTLKNIESFLSEYTQIVKCHKSYLVNLQKVTEIHKTETQHFLYIEEQDLKIPISRHLTRKILDQLSPLKVIK